jgi:excinuclease UvrABC helicase subunit UvrB
MPVAAVITEIWQNELESNRNKLAKLLSSEMKMNTYIMTAYKYFISYFSYFGKKMKAAYAISMLSLCESPPPLTIEYLNQSL